MFLPVARFIDAISDDGLYQKLRVLTMNCLSASYGCVGHLLFEFWSKVNTAYSRTGKPPSILALMSLSLSARVIDGSILEGGGQLLRIAIALSALLLEPITINKVRNGRTPPGLKNQHAAGIQLAAEICSADVTGAEIRSCSIDFRPGRVHLPGNFSADPGTAGSTTLLLQVSLPCLLFSPSSGPSTLTLRGGTNATQAPQIDYTQHIFLPFLRRQFGLDVLLDVRKRGYYPRGGGTVSCSVPPYIGPLPAVTLIERGAVSSIRGQAQVGGLPAHIARTMSAAATAKLVSVGVNPDIIDITALREKDENVVGYGSGIVLWAETQGGCVLGGSSVGKKGLDPAVVGEAAATELLHNLEHGGCVDEYLQDQIIIFLALAEGESTVKTGPLTLHTRTAIWVAEQMTRAKFEIEEDPSGQCTIRCQGIGMKASHTIHGPTDI